jgi:hypothetical protein
MSDIFGSLAAAVTRAIDRDLPDIKYKCKLYDKKREDGSYEMEDCARRPHLGEVEVYHFPQTWSDTSCGFGGIAGQAFTTIYTTVVIESMTNAAVYMGGRHAYTVQCISEEFEEDLRNHRMAAARGDKRKALYSRKAADGPSGGGE